MINIHPQKKMSNTVQVLEFYSSTGTRSDSRKKDCSAFWCVCCESASRREMIGHKKGKTLRDGHFFYPTRQANKGKYRDRKKPWTDGRLARWC